MFGELIVISVGWLLSIKAKELRISGFRVGGNPVNKTESTRPRQGGER